MSFSLHGEGPAGECGAKCRRLVSAAGMITGETAQQFVAFVRENSVHDATVVLESDGGSVLGALELGRAIRRLGFATTVGRVVERHAKHGASYGELITRADCQSMCAFVLLAGTTRQVAPDARVLVHQIWLGDRREDAVAANYTAEDLVVVQRDIGSILQYTVDMGGDIELMALSLKIPPWEPMRALSRGELRRTHLDQGAQAVDTPSVVRTAAGPTAAGDEAQSIPVHSRGWLMVNRPGRPILARSHPLTFEGERIGSFNLFVGCGDTPETYVLTYREIRSGPADRGPPQRLTQVALSIDDQVREMTITASARGTRPGELESVAKTAVPARLVRTLAADTPASMTLATESSGNPRTAIRVGNAGFTRNFRTLDAACKEPQPAPGDARAELQTPRPANVAARVDP